jgi:hypothetical protein
MSFKGVLQAELCLDIITSGSGAICKWPTGKIDILPSLK